MYELSAQQCCLSFFAHPDDETLAAGASIAKLVRLGAEVHVAIPATGVHGRRRLQPDIAARTAELADLRCHCREAMTLLGVPGDQLYLGEFSDNELDRHTRLELIHWLENIIEQVQPQLILTHHRYCTNIDHRYCHEAAVVASRPAANRHIHLLCGEVPGSTGALKPAQWEPNLYLEVSTQDLDCKLRALQAYRGEVRAEPHPRSPAVLEALARVRGAEAGFQFAEAFMIQRLFA